MHLNQAGCPLWPECGCGTEDGPTTCVWKHNRGNLQAQVKMLQQVIDQQQGVIRTLQAEIARLQPLKGTDDDGR